MSFAIHVLLGFAVLIGAVSILVFLLGHARIPRRVNATRTQAALDQVCLTIPGLERTGTGQATLVRRGYPAIVEYIGGVNPSTRMTFSIEGGVDGWVQVAPVSFRHEILKEFGVTDLEIDDPAFDNTHEIRASEQKVAFAVLTPDARRMLTNLGRRWDFVYRVNPHVTTLQVDELLYDPVQLDTFVDFGIMFFDLLKLPERDAVVIQEHRVSVDDAVCRVCGSALATGAVVRCAKCRTPHHRDCWTFNGLCATFACGEKRFQ